MIKKICICLAVVVLLLSGCDKDNNKNVENNMNPDIPVSSLSVVNSKEDTQPYWLDAMGRNISKGDGGYYTLDKSKHVLVYIEGESCNPVILCDKADCSHDDMTCNAYLHPLNYNTSVYYYKDFVYFLKHVNGNMVLERCSVTGGKREELFDLGTETDGASGLNLVFENDCVYAYRWDSIGMNDDVTVTIRERSLDGKKDNIIARYTGTGLLIDGVRSYGDKLFYILQSVNTSARNAASSEEGAQFQSYGLYAYDYITKETIRLSLEDIFDYSIDTDTNTLYYFVKEKGLHKKQLDSQSEGQLIYACDELSMLCHMSLDSRYIYLDNFRWINMCMPVSAVRKIYAEQGYVTTVKVIDREGKLINEIPYQRRVYFGDDRYIFGRSSMGIIECIDKKEIESAKEWKTIEF